MPSRRLLTYDPGLRQRARTLRKDATPAERRLWPEIRRKRVHGYSFYRQHPVDRYITDFFCPDLMLAIEVDGCSHDGRYAYDLHRQRRLEALGIDVLRFMDHAVMEDLSSVLLAIESAVERRAVLTGTRTSP